MLETARDAELYDALHAGNPGDVAFYVAMCRGAARIMELACGSGRVARAIAQATPGARVVGVDYDPHLLALARARASGAPAAVQWIEADIRHLALGERFDRVLIPFTSIYALGGVDGVAACLERAYAHLAPGGSLLFDAYPSHVVATSDPQPYDSGFGPIAEILWRGERVGVEERDVTGPGGSWVSVTYRFHLAGGDMITQQGRHDIVPWPLLEDLLRGVGFSTVAAFGGFDGAPWGAEAEHLVAVATR